MKGQKIHNQNAIFTKRQKSFKKNQADSRAEEFNE